MAFQYDMQNALTFMHSQRMHGVRLGAYWCDALTDETSLGAAGPLQPAARPDHRGADKGNCAPCRP